MAYVLLGVVGGAELLHAPEGEAFPAEGSPISRALRRLGVIAAAGEDEFATVGLGRRRDTEDWLD